MIEVTVEPADGRRLVGNIMNRELVFVCMLLGFAVHSLAGCAWLTKGTSVQTTELFGPGDVSPETANAMSLAFVDDHTLRVKEAVETLMADYPGLENRRRLNVISLNNAYSAFAIAAGPNPIVAMLDMLVMVSLQREAIRRLAIDRTLTEPERERPESYDIDDDQLQAILGPEHRRLLRAFTTSEREIRALANQVFWPDQIEELDKLMEDWWAVNPHRRLVSHVRLQDFSQARTATVETGSSGPRSVFGLLRLDPLASLDPTTREVAQMRLLTERVAWQVNRLPILVSMHAKDLMYESLTTDELVSIRTTLEDTEESIERFVDVADRWPQDVEGVIAEVEAAVSRQREETLLAFEDRAEQLQGALAELDATLKTATVLTGSVTDTVRSIDDMTTKMHERSVDEEPTNMVEVQQLVDSAVGGVSGIERSLSTIERLLAPETFDDASSSKIDRGVTVATAGTKDLVDHAFWRGVQLAAIVLVGWVVAVTTARLLAARLLSRTRARES
ncbi:MAG: hypothetical protein ACE5Q3_16575 [Alphaproteobacteria bacterium]